MSRYITCLVLVRHSYTGDRNADEIQLFVVDENNMYTLYNEEHADKCKCTHERAQMNRVIYDTSARFFHDNNAAG